MIHYPPRSRDARLGAAIADVLGFALAICLAVALASSCRPNLPPVAGCTVGAFACVDGRPVVCSQSWRWEPIGDRTCASVGAVCVVDDGGPAHCARATPDAAAGAPDASDGG